MRCVPLILLTAFAELVYSHGAIVRVVGDAGGQGSAIGIDPSTPRDGTKRRPFQQDSTRFRGPNKDSCGETIGAGQNNIESGLRQVIDQMGSTLPQANPGGKLTLTVHQVNGDGAGPYRCEIDTSGTGQNWRRVRVLRNVPGKRGNSRNKKQDFPLEVRVPRRVRCRGSIAGQDNVCLGRCKNPARAGPFGGCYAFQVKQKQDQDQKQDQQQDQQDQNDQNDDAQPDDVAQKARRTVEHHDGDDDDHEHEHMHSHESREVDEFLEYDPEFQRELAEEDRGD